jgi:hypothetical protein
VPISSIISMSKFVRDSSRCASSSLPSEQCPSRSSSSARIAPPPARSSALRHEVRRRVDRGALQHGDRLAGERVEAGDPLDLVAPQLDAHPLLVVGGVDLDRVAAHAEGAALEGGVVALYWMLTSPARISLRRISCPTSSVSISARYSCGSPRP